MPQLTPQFYLELDNFFLKRDKSLGTNIITEMKASHGLQFFRNTGKSKTLGFHCIEY
jgi:hypothetical protein